MWNWNMQSQMLLFQVGISRYWTSAHPANGGIWICGSTRRTSQHAYLGTGWMDVW